MTKTIEIDNISLSESKSVQTVLKVLRRVTGLRAVMIAEAGEELAKINAVLDESGFGLQMGDALDSSTTYCQIVWKTKKPLHIEHASQNPDFSSHPGLKVHGVESYMSVPVFRSNGEIFGNLCAFDTVPAQLSAENIELFEIFSELITYELESQIEKNQLAEKLETAKELSETRTRLMSILGHDLRNPLNTILMAAKIQLRNENADAQTTDLAQKIVRSGERMQKLINDILDTAKKERHLALPDVREEVDLCELLTQITEEFRLSHPDQTIELSGDESCSGLWNTGRIVQVYSNLLSNAVQHSEKNSPVVINLEGKKEAVEVSVWNRGKVITDEDKENLFEPFWQGSQKNTSNKNGLGLGLYIVQQIMKLQGGRIEVASSAAEGTKFTAVFPR